MNLTHMYRSVLKKCALINSAIIVGALATTISIMSNDVYANTCLVVEIPGVDTHILCDGANTAADWAEVEFANYDTYIRNVDNVIDFSNLVIFGNVYLGAGTQASLRIGSSLQTDQVQVGLNNFINNSGSTLEIIGSNSNNTTVTMNTLSNIAGSTVDLNSNAILTLINGFSDGNKANFNLNGGTLKIGNNGEKTLQNNSTGIFTWNDGTITASSITNSGTFIINGATITATFDSLTNTATGDNSFNLENGTLILINGFNNSNQGNFNLDGNSILKIGRTGQNTLVNDAGGTFNWNGGTIIAESIYNNEGGIFNWNKGTAQFDSIVN